MNEKLELLSLAKNFTINKVEKSYGIESVIDNLGATIYGNEITYYVTGCYDSGIDWLSFDENEFKKLKDFCELMIKENR